MVWDILFWGKSKRFQWTLHWKNDGVYVNDGTRGADVYYKDTELTEITSILGDGEEVTFKAVSHYVSPDDNSPMEDKVNDFSIVVEDGSYHVKKFTLPY